MARASPKKLKVLFKPDNVEIEVEPGSNLLQAAIDAGVTIIHISTELRLAWRKGLERGLKENPEERYSSTAVFNMYFQKVLK